MNSYSLLGLFTLLGALTMAGCGGGGEERPLLFAPTDLQGLELA